MCNISFNTMHSFGDKLKFSVCIALSISRGINILPVLVALVQCGAHGGIWQKYLSTPVGDTITLIA